MTNTSSFFVPERPVKAEAREDMSIVIVGHVDHGKSTVIGRLLADIGSLPEGKFEAVREICRRNAKPFEYAFLLDALKDERAQGITIDNARCFFKTKHRNYIIIDAPGHIEFLKNMVTGASRAEAALLVIDAAEGVQENSRRHSYMLQMLGIKQVAVLINKMDLVNYDKQVFNHIKDEYSIFLNQIKIEPKCFIPTSGIQGDNIMSNSLCTPWYQGPTVLETLDRFPKVLLDHDKPFRMPVQDVYKFTGEGDTRRIIAGTIASGKIHVDEEVCFYPSGKRSKIRSIEMFNRSPVSHGEAGWAVGFTITEQIYVKRGNLMVAANEHPPQVAARLRVNLFWLGHEALAYDRDYYLKLETDKVKMRVESIVRVMDAATLEIHTKEKVEQHDVAECILCLERPIAFDLAHKLSATSRFVIVDGYEISGGGIVTEALANGQTIVQEVNIEPNFKWEKNEISLKERAAKYHQQATLVLLTGTKDVSKKTLAKALERQLFSEGKMVYFMGIDNVLYGVDGDLKKTDREYREKHLHQLSKIAHLMLDAGLILIVTELELTQAELDTIKRIIETSQVLTVWLGEPITTDIDYDLLIPTVGNTAMAVDTIQNQLQKWGLV